jgi:hypothetical protein
MMRSPERRRRRSADATVALRYQLEACRAEGKLDAILLADEDGLCLAYAGSTESAGEVAAQAPIFGRKTERFRGVLLSHAGGTEIVVKRFDVGGTTMFACAVGRADDRSETLVQRTIGGASRILGA